MASIVDGLQVAADAASVITAVVAVGFWGGLKCKRQTERTRLESYLKSLAPPNNYDNGIRTIVHLMAELKLSEEQVLSAALSSKIVRCWSVADENGRGEQVMFQYSKTGQPPPQSGLAALQKAKRRSSKPVSK